MITKLC